MLSPPLARFKEHVQNNNPKHFLSEEEFIQLRVELANANISTVVGEDGETPTPAADVEELPPGTEDLPDPAKVHRKAHPHPPPGGHSGSMPPSIHPHPSSHMHRLACIPRNIILSASTISIHVSS